MNKKLKKYDKFMHKNKEQRVQLKEEEDSVFNWPFHFALMVVWIVGLFPIDYFYFPILFMT